MTIEELIQQLSKYDPKTPVVVRGYEGGYNDVSLIQPKTIQLNVNDRFYYGTHDCVKGLVVPNKTMVDIIYLGGYNPICDDPELSYR